MGLVTAHVTTSPTVGVIWTETAHITMSATSFQTALATTPETFFLTAAVTTQVTHVVTVSVTDSVTNLVTTPVTLSMTVRFTVFAICTVTAAVKTPMNETEFSELPIESVPREARKLPKSR